MSRKKLLILSFSTITADARVLKQVAQFSDAFDVTTCSYGGAPEGVVDHIRIPDEYPIWRYDRALVVARQFRRAYWSNKAVAAAQAGLIGKPFDVVLANDVDAVGLALSLEPADGVHADLHEYAPRQKEDIPRWRHFVAPFVRWMCRTWVSRAASVTTVGRGIADEYQREYGIHAGVVTNAAPYVEITAGAVSCPVRLVHSGACLKDRNIDLIVDAVEAASADVTLDLYLTPNDPAYLTELAERARTSRRVTLHAPVPYAQLAETLNAYDVGVHILPPVNFNNKWALPNKFFDYVQARLGVIIGPSPEMANTLKHYGFGAVADDFSVDALTREINSLEVETVAAWKHAADAAAAKLSSAAQVAVWREAIDSLASGGDLR